MILKHKCFYCKYYQHYIVDIISCDVKAFEIFKFQIKIKINLFARGPHCTKNSSMYQKFFKLSVVINKDMYFKLKTRKTQSKTFF